MATNITFPNNNSTLIGITDVVATSNDSTLTGIRFLLNGQVQFVDNSSPYVFTFDTTSFNNSAYILTAQSILTTGSSTDGTKNITIQNQKNTSNVDGSLSSATLGQFFGISIAILIGLSIIYLIYKMYIPRGRR